MSNLVKTEAIVLSRSDFSNTSRIFTFLTPAHGLVGAILKGARRPTGRAGLGGGLDLLSENEILYYARRGGSLAVLAEWSEMRSWPELGNSAARLAASGVLAEFALRCASEGEDSQGAYALLGEWTRLAAGAQRLLPAALGAALGLLSLAGFRPAAAACAACGRRPSGGAWKRGAVLSAGGLGLLCERCSPGRGPKDGSVRLSGEACGLLGALLRLKPAAAVRLRPSRRAEVELMRAIETYACWRLECRMRSLSMLARVIEGLETAGLRCR